MLRRVVSLGLSIALWPGAAGGAGAPVPDHAELDRILRTHVRDERVDYLLLRKHDGEALGRYLDGLSRVDVNALPERERLALYFNLYNAAMLRAVIDRFHADYTPAEDSWSVFDEPLIRFGERRLSLNALEHEVLRREFREPRLHVALVCAARSCPPLLPRAYRGEDLDAVLDGNMRRFLRDPTRNRIDRKGRRLVLSRLFDWYAEDFGGPSTVAAWVDRYVDGDVTGYAVEFLEYSWELNLAPPAAGRWVAIDVERSPLRAGPGDAAGGGEARRGEVLEVLEERGGWLRVDVPGGGAAWVGARDTRPWSSR